MERIDTSSVTCGGLSGWDGGAGDEAAGLRGLRSGIV